MLEIAKREAIATSVGWFHPGCCLRVSWFESAHAVLAECICTHSPCGTVPGQDRFKVRETGLSSVAWHLLECARVS